MAVINISLDDLKKLKCLKTSGHNNGGKLHIYNDELLYKIFYDRNFFIDEKERNVDFLSKLSIPNCTPPIDKILIDGKFYGYSLKYIKCAQTFKEGINNVSLSLKRKLEIIKDIYIPLKYLHAKELYLGDVHLDNFIYDNQKGYLIDLDDVRFKYDDFKFKTYYNLRETQFSPLIVAENANTDNIKTTICSLSFIYGINIEEYIKNNSIESLCQIIKQLSLSKSTKNYIIDNLKNLDGTLSYFGEYLDEFDDQCLSYNKEKILKLIKK